MSMESMGGSRKDKPKRRREEPAPVEATRPAPAEAAAGHVEPATAEAGHAPATPTGEAVAVEAAHAEVPKEPVHEPAGGHETPVETHAHAAEAHGGHGHDAHAADHGHGARHHGESHGEHGHAHGGLTAKEAGKGLFSSVGSLLGGIAKGAALIPSRLGFIAVGLFVAATKKISDLFGKAVNYIFSRKPIEHLLGPFIDFKKLGFGGSSGGSHGGHEKHDDHGHGGHDDHGHGKKDDHGHGDHH